MILGETCIGPYGRATMIQDCGVTGKIMCLGCIEVAHHWYLKFFKDEPLMPKTDSCIYPEVIEGSIIPRIKQ
jgi:hypothetical protein